MTNKDFSISFKTMWFLVMGGMIFIMPGSIAKIQQWSYAPFLLVMGLLLFFVTWVVILGDIFRNRIYNQSFWIAVMFVLPSIAGILYMLRRNRLLRPERNF